MSMLVISIVFCGVVLGKIDALDLQITQLEVELEQLKEAHTHLKAETEEGIAAIQTELKYAVWAHIERLEDWAGLERYWEEVTQ